MFGNFKFGNWKLLFLFSIFYFLVSGSLVLLSTFYFLLSSKVFAASPTFYFETAEDAIAPDSLFSVKVLVDSPVLLNAYELAIAYSSDIAELVASNDGNSIIDVAQSPLTVFGGGEITITGGSLQPFQGEGGEIITLRFHARKEGEMAFLFQNAIAYQADGKGTKITGEQKDLVITVRSGEKVVREELAPDTAPPRIEFLSIIPDPIHKGQNLLGFSVRDKESGTKSIRARSRAWLWWNERQDVINPTPLGRNVWAVEFAVYDNAGNVATRVLYNWPVFFRNMSFATLFLLFAVFVVINRKRRFHK